MDISVPSIELIQGLIDAGIKDITRLFERKISVLKSDMSKLTDEIRDLREQLEKKKNVDSTTKH